MLINWLDLEEILWENFFVWIFFKKFWMCFFKVKHSVGHISGKVGPMDVKRKKQVHWLDTWYTLCPWPLTSLMTLALDFEIAVSEELLVWLVWNEKEAN